jgi:hypothetical protein
MATELRSTKVGDPHERPVLLQGIRWNTWQAILEDLGDRRGGMTYDEGTLEFKTSVLLGIRWETFEAILNDLGDHRGVRLAYDGGRLEFMSPSRKHDQEKRLIGRMVEAFSEVARIPIGSGGSVTLRRPELAKGVEPDECYWIAHEAAVRGRGELDFAVDPAPDLAIYARLGVSEVWRFEDESLLIYALQPDGSYVLRADSPGLPRITPAVIERFIRLSTTTDETTWILAFRDWASEQIAARGHDAAH